MGTRARSSSLISLCSGEEPEDLYHRRCRLRPHRPQRGRREEYTSLGSDRLERGLGRRACRHVDPSTRSELRAGARGE